MDGSLGPQYSYFRDFSPGNMAYLWMQGAREIVGKQIDWTKVGRHVIKSGRAYEIIRPIFRRVVTLETEDDEEVHVDTESGAPAVGNTKPASVACPVEDHRLSSHFVIFSMDSGL